MEMYPGGYPVKKKHLTLYVLVFAALMVVATVMLCTNRKMEHYGVKDDEFIVVQSVQFATPVDSWVGKKSYFNRYDSGIKRIEVAITGNVVTVRIHYITNLAKDYSTHITGIDQVIIYGS